MRVCALLILFLLLIQDPVKSVRIVELRVPAHAAEGGEALLSCQYDMEGDVLYSLKWYKDGRQFYRYVPTMDSPIAHFSTPGVIVDMARSSSDVVSLVHLTKESAGLYSCEVSGEAPLFNTVAAQKYITVQLLPEDGPRITGLQHHYDVGERVVGNCTSRASRPEAQLRWLVNGRAAPRRHLQGPWYRLSAARPDATDTILQLRFTVDSTHYVNNVMKFQCQATIAPLYQQQTEHEATAPVAEKDERMRAELARVLDELSHVDEPSTTTLPESDSADKKDHGVMAQTSLYIIVISALLLKFLNFIFYP